MIDAKPIDPDVEIEGMIVVQAALRGLTIADLRSKKRPFRLSLARHQIGELLQREMAVSNVQYARIIRKHPSAFVHWRNARRLERAANART